MKLDEDMKLRKFGFYIKFAKFPSTFNYLFTFAVSYFINQEL